MKANRKHIFTLLLSLMSLAAWAQEEFSLGADISWCTEQESRGNKCYNYNGEEREATALMKEMGLNAIRLRVWVDPSEHGNWCNKEDVLVKALRAKALNMDVMIDFHYSDWWADPAKQNIPAAWAKHKYKQLLVDVAEHTKEVLQLLKDNGVEPKWVQVGNETANGFLWPVGQLDTNPKQYAGLFNAGYEAVKAIFPDTKVLVHLDRGHRNELYNHNLDALKENGAKWDMIGMSLYPYWVNKDGANIPAMKIINDCIKNINAVAKKYGTDVMIVETGFEVNEEEPWIMECGRTQLEQVLRLCRTSTNGHCKGVFYWEPTCKPTHYKLGAFTKSGHPTAIMRAFTTTAMDETLNINADARGNIIYDRPRIVMETTAGKIVMELYNETPKHRDNYIKLAKSGVMKDMLIHRVMKNFMIQMGDPASKSAEPTIAGNPAPALGGHSVTNDKGEEYTIPAEFTVPMHFNKRGAISAARADESVNPEKASSSSQFFIVYGRWPTARIAGSNTDPLPYYLEAQHAGVPYLDNEYTVFGEVIQGMDRVEKIQKVNTDSNDRPLDDIKILSFDVVE
ncbi:MAG: glycosyl hydrolase 53 family protein [Prevotella sp.]|nr:glycosyl hydrolase 53 family protein [Candidatus Prevotella equi]